MVGLTGVARQKHLATGRKYYKPVYVLDGRQKGSRLNFFRQRDAVSWGQKVVVRLERLRKLGRL